MDWLNLVYKWRVTPGTAAGEVRVGLLELQFLHFILKKKEEETNNAKCEIFSPIVLHSNIWSIAGCDCLPETVAIKCKCLSGGDVGQ